MTLITEVKARRRLPSPSLARELRRSAGLSQARIAKELGVTRVTVARWESGTRSPRGSLMVAYVELLEDLREAE
ncbi:hypothetical protein N864_07620 [Intrasporangium chromatireducens Q5-1]|uniref:HTH cro/C1-type domain-containing protein n=1 Tax=Intrasporangium chromatireducens Q5-1 TaxID=584657 RepID=W9GFR8_9MICO|nr:hypothetical protein N864_07620 [Intrasporangium chromatireducens Q5-1]